MTELDVTQTPGRRTGRLTASGGHVEPSGDHQRRLTDRLIGTARPTAAAAAAAESDDGDGDETPTRDERHGSATEI